MTVVGQIWRNQAKISQYPAAWTGANAYFAKKIQARRGNALQTRNRETVVLDTSHFKRIGRVYEAGELQFDLAELDEGEDC